MLIFSNKAEGFVLKIAALLGMGASLLPVISFIAGKSPLRESAIVFLVFFSLTLFAYIIRRETIIEVKLTETALEVMKPVKKTNLKIPYEEIKEVIYSELSFSRSLTLRDGKKVNLGSTITTESGEFTVPELYATAPQGRPGERFRLKLEIESRINTAKSR